MNRRQREVKPVNVAVSSAASDETSCFLISFILSSG